MGGLECVITGLMDEFRDFFRRFRISREMFTAIVVFFSFFVALSCITPVSRGAILYLILCSSSTPFINFMIL
jgi:hypothetical protein